MDTRFYRLTISGRVSFTDDDGKIESLLMQAHQAHQVIQAQSDEFQTAIRELEEDADVLTVTLERLVS